MVIEILILIIIFIIAAAVMLSRKQMKKAAIFLGLAALSTLFAVYTNYLAEL